MKLLLRRLSTEWPSWAAVAFIALLPFGRLSEIPLSLFALSLPFVARSADHRRNLRRAAPLVLALFACFWLPMLASATDSMNPGKSWSQSLAALRFPAAALSMAVLLHAPSARWRVLRWTAFLLVFWALDGFVQLLFGNDLFGITMHPDRLNALFVDKYQFYGPTLAMLSPLLLEYARREWPAWAWSLSFTLILGAVMISGMRSGWLSMAIVLVTYVLLMFQRENRELRRTMLTVPALAVLILTLSYLASPLFQERLELTRAVAEGTGEAIDYASSERLPIFTTAWRMYRNHPVNGVGVRAFPVAYMIYADEDDIHIQKSGGVSGATHAHNVVLEVMADTGTIGLIGLLLGAIIAARSWLRAPPARRQDAFPAVLALVLVLFPLNSHFAIYGTYTSSLIWFLVGLWAATIRPSVLPGASATAGR
ncbi:O-antigen ligase family protein [Elongatibacter sediminis]|uniref:O-antigen ligase family protein n=1 Tax=Elongatibacter sediminis TaxID=3119006 RepID=A0AAW9R7Z5_9GAMM